MPKENENRWAEIEKILGKDKEEKKERNLEIDEELLTKDPEEIVAGLDFREDVVPRVVRQIREAQEDYQSQIGSTSEDLKNETKAIWTKTIKGIIGVWRQLDNK